MGAMTDARLLLGSAVALPVAFAVLVLLPFHRGEIPQALGLEALWAVAGLLFLVLGPVAWGLIGYVSGITLVFGQGVSAADRLLHVATLVVLAAFVALLASETGTAAMEWWFD